MRTCMLALVFLILLSLWLLGLAVCVYGVRSCLQNIIDSKSCAFERILFAAQALLCVAGIACLILLPLQKIVERYGELL